MVKWEGGTSVLGEASMAGRGISPVGRGEKTGNVGGVLSEVHDGGLGGGRVFTSAHTTHTHTYYSIFCSISLAAAVPSTCMILCLSRLTHEQYIKFYTYPEIANSGSHMRIADIMHAIMKACDI